MHLTCEKITRQLNHTDFPQNGTFEHTPIKPTFNDFRAQNERVRSTAHIIPYMQIWGAISHFAA